MNALVLALVVKSLAFAEGAPIPKPFTCEGVDESPRIDVERFPEGTKSWAIVVDDPDAPRKEPWVHWVAWNFSASDHGVGPAVAKEAALPSGARQGTNDFGKLGWGGPCPPPGKVHHYRFHVFALDAPLSLASGARAADLQRAIKGHVLGEGTLVGTYKR